MKTIKDQKLTFGPKYFKEDGHTRRITATVRHDDKCGNGKNSFSVTGSIHHSSGSRWVDGTSGCIHDEIEKHFPELRHLIKWHLCDTSGPMHYIANTTYHARIIPHDQDKWFFYLEGKLIKIVDGVGKFKMRAKYGKNAEFKMHENPLAKHPNLDAARRCAVWPDATLEQLRDEKQLTARLPDLIARFRADVEALGLTFNQ